MMSQQDTGSLFSEGTDGQEERTRATPRGNSAPRLAPKYQIRRIKSKGALLVLAWVFLVFGAFLTMFRIAIDDAWLRTHGTHILQSQPVAVVILSICCPFAGWLADVYFGRYRVIYAGLWLMWVGTVLGTLVLAVQYTICNYDSVRQAVLAVDILAAILVTTGFASFVVNSVQFGMDQMPDASGEQISAFIHWYMWMVFAAYAVVEVTSLLQHCAQITLKCAQLQTYQMLVPSALLSLALCLTFWLRDYLIIEPQSQNPLKTITGVLKFACTHKRPIRQS